MERFEQIKALRGAVELLRRHGFRATIDAFRREERGSMIVFGLFCFMIMLLLAGVALDLMRFESERTRIQNTLDRAVLAAADMNQSIDAQEVVDDYFVKAGLGHLVPVEVDPYRDFNSSRVTATTGMQVPTWFMRFVGIPVLKAPAAGTAEERIGNVEISLVLDVSGSMGDKASGTNKTKIQLLREAGEEFVDTMFDKVQGPGSIPGKLSISVIPYAQQVTLGSDLGANFKLSNEHNSSFCADFSDSDFYSTAISPTQTLNRTIVADVRYTNAALQFVECDEDAWRRVLAFANNRTTLKNHIKALQAEGDTGIDIGAKWGAAFLDPATRPVLDARISAGKADGNLSGRPYDYATDGSREYMKVMVLMTDGQNTNSYAIKPPYRSGLSNLVRAKKGSAAEKFYYYHAARSGTAKYYDPTASSSARWKTKADIIDNGKEPTHLSYQDLWAKHPVRYFQSTYYNPATGSSGNTLFNAAVEHRGTSDANAYNVKDDRLKWICDAAKTHKVLIYTVAFEATAKGETALRNCATGPGFYYKATGSSIKDAFAGIASSINTLRLTH